MCIYVGPKLGMKGSKASSMTDDQKSTAPSTAKAFNIYRPVRRVLEGEEKVLREMSDLIGFPVPPVEARLATPCTVVQTSVYIIEIRTPH